MALPASDHSSPHAADAVRPASEQRVGKYRILSELGRGGTANVYLAVARGQGGVSKLVVLKALLPEFARDPVVLSMFLDEARLAAQLNHANIVQTYEIGTEASRSVIVMEYLEGQSLSRLLRYAERSGEPLPVAMQLRILTNTLEGLHYAHELASYDGTPLQLVHRDVSPQNVFVTYDGQVKLVDFGIAQSSTSTHNETATGLVKGKIAYMAPEQMTGEAVDRRADVYSVGCMVWAVAAGTKLWKDTPDVQIVRRVTRGEVPSPKSVNPYCPDELERIAMRALAFDPDERYASAIEMQADLERYAEQLGGAVKPRDLGRFVSHLFAAARAELRDSIERQLAALALENTDEPPLIEREFASDTSQLRPVELGAGARQATAAERNRWLPWLAVVFAAALAGSLLAFWWPGERAAEEGDRIERVDRTVHAASRPSATASLVESAPPSASAAPLTAAAAPEPARAPPPRTAVPRPGRGSRAAAARAAAAPEPSSAAPEPSADPPTPSCKTPFYIDSGGIKRVRPECL